MRFFEIFDKKKVIRFCQKVSVTALVALLIAIRAMNVGVEKGIQIAEARFEQEALAKELEEQRIAQENAERIGLVSEAEACARVLFGTARDNDPVYQKAVVWCIINRCENANYPDTIQAVCAQSKQWMGYSESNPIVQELYDIAKGELEIWHSGGYRPITPDYIFMSWTSDEVTLRTTFKEDSHTRYWTPAKEEVKR